MSSNPVETSELFLDFIVTLYLRGSLSLVFFIRSALIYTSCLYTIVVQTSTLHQLTGFDGSSEKKTSNSQQQLRVVRLKGFIRNEPREEKR